MCRLDRAMWPPGLSVVCLVICRVLARNLIEQHTVQLFAIVPLSALGVGPEVSNNMSKCPLVAREETVIYLIP